jgi:UDPglucose 6-dehydrogenase
MSEREEKDNLETKISVFGIGKLGFPIIACFGSKGYRVIGYDVNPDTIEAVNDRNPKLNEPGLNELLVQAKDVSATDNYKNAVENTDITFIVVPTPSLEDGSFSTKYAEIAAGQIAEGIKNNNSYHLVVLTSTVLPGATEEKIKPILEKVSGKQCGADFGLCYSPEFIALGSVIKDFLNPDVILIGEHDSKSGEILEKVYKTVCDNNPPVARMSIRNAELSKISLNSYVTMKISFANTISELCELMPGGDAEAVSGILGFDSRIGRKYLSGALAYGGPCFPRDNRAFSFFAKSVGKEALLAQATDKENKHQNERIVSIINNITGSIRGKKIAVLGLTYKPNTDVIEESAAIKISEALKKEGAYLKVYDPLGMKNAMTILGDKNIQYADSIQECIRNAEVCIVATPWQEFKNLTQEDYLSVMKSPILIDCWRMYNPGDYSKMTLLTIGRNKGKKNDE